MQAIYPYANIIHLSLAIIFLGYVFFDTIILNLAKRKMSNEVFEACSKSIKSIAIKIMPISLVVIILTGGMMMSQYMNSNLGWFDTTLQKLLSIKIALALLIALGVIFNLTAKRLGKPSPFMAKNFHYIVLVLGFSIVILAKLMLFS